jgi:hypothetical protein
MATAPSTTHQHGTAFRGFDESVERAVGADMRLLYGMAAPILLVVGVIILLALNPATWLVATVVVVEIVALAVVVYGFVGMLNGDDEDDATVT